MKKIISVVLSLAMLLSMSTSFVLPISAENMQGAAAPVTNQQNAFGDITGDGEVDISDAIRLIRYLTDDSIQVNASALDVNGDGEVDISDAIRLVRSLTGDDTEPEDDRPISEMEHNPDIKSILFLGTDRSDFGKNQYYRTGGQSDTIMILSMDTKKKEYFVVIINRNLAVPVQMYSKNGDDRGIQLQQICLAHAYGDGGISSINNTKMSLGTLFGDDIKYLGFIEMPMTNIGPINDLFGGVTVTIEDDFSGYYNETSSPFSSVNPIDFAIGNTLTLKGDQAEAYNRARYKMYADTSNPARIRRQKTYLTSLRDKIKSEMSVKQLVDIYDDVLKLTMTDMSKAEIAKWIAEIYDYKFKGFYELNGIEGEKILGARAYYPDQKETDSIRRLYYK